MMNGAKVSSSDHYAGANFYTLYKKRLFTDVVLIAEQDGTRYVIYAGCIADASVIIPPSSAPCTASNQSS